MKKAAFLLVMLIGLGTTAQAQLRPTLYAHAGLSVPTFPSSFKDFYQTGVHFGVGVGLPVSRRTEVTLSAQFSRYRLDEDALRAEFEEFDVFDVAFDGGAYAWFGLSANLKYKIYAQSRFGPYALFGLGLYNSAADDLVIIESGDSSTRAGNDEIIAGLNGGIGFYVPVSPALRLGGWPDR